GLAGCDVDGTANDLSRRDFEAGIVLAAEIELVNGVITQHHAVETVTGASVVRRPGGSRRWRIGEKQETNLLVSADGQTCGTKLREDAVGLRGREKIDLHRRASELRCDLLPARSAVVGGWANVDLHGANGDEDVSELSIRRRAAGRVTDRNLNHSGGGGLLGRIATAATNREDD